MLCWNKFCGVYSMRKVIVILIFIYSCTFNQQPTQEKSTASSFDWIVDSVKNKMDNPSVVTDKDVKYLYFHHPSLMKPAIIAWITLDRLNGGIYVYTWKNNKYELVFQENRPVYSVQVMEREPSFLVFSSGMGGTGQQTNNYQVLLIRNNATKTLWKGTAEDFNFNGNPPYHYKLGAISFNAGGDEMIYSVKDRMYNNREYEIDKPNKSVDSIKIYKYNFNDQTFSLKQ